MNKKSIDNKNKIFLTKYSFLVFLLFFFITFFINKVNAIENKILVKVNNHIITSVDILNQINYLYLLNDEFKRFEDKQIFEIAKNALIKEKVKEIELKKYFKSLIVEDQFIEPIVKDYFEKYNINSIISFKSFLIQNNLKFENIKRKISLQLLWNRLIYKKFSQNVKIDKVLIEQKIKKNKIQKEFLLSEIIFSVQNKSNFEKKLKLIKKTINEEGFSRAAIVHSISDSAKNSGKIGWVKESSISNNIRKEIENLGVGKITNPIQIPGGFLILILEDKKEVKIEVDFQKELDSIVAKKTNEQLNQYSNIHFQKIKKNININEL